MKIYFVNVVYGRGSTGRIVRDLAEYGSGHGHLVRAAYGRGPKDNGIGTYRFNRKTDIYRHAALARLCDGVGLYSEGATKRLTEDIERFSPDIIHLHILHGYYVDLHGLFGFLKRYGRPVVWTMHDCWAFTGHCTHFTSAGCERWRTGCHHCEQTGEYPKSYRDHSSRNYMWKRQLFTGLDNMTIVTVSDWLKDMTEQSFLKRYRTERIYNGIDIRRFSPVGSKWREVHNCTDQKVVLSVADGWDERKGYSRILELAEKTKGRFAIVLIGLNHKQLKALPDYIIGYGRVWNQDELIQIYSAADVFFNASHEETFGLVTLEAMACNTPVVVYESTACPEVMDESSGVTVQKGCSVKKLEEAILLASGKKGSVERAGAFSIERMSGLYYQLYETIRKLQ